MFDFKFILLLVTIERSAAYGDEPLKHVNRFNNYLPTSCREVVYKEAKSPLACSQVRRGDIGQGGLLELDHTWETVAQLSQDKYTDDNVYNDLLMDFVARPTGAPGEPNGAGVPNGAKQNPTLGDSNTKVRPDFLPGACRWDYLRSNQGLSACMCPATKSTCSVDRKECYWYRMPEEKAKGLKNQGIVFIPTHACINSAERFYYLLAGLLKKRGKKDFAIKIRYGATPARGQLPLGPYGPAIIGGGAFSSEGLAKQTLAKNLLSRFSNPGWTPHQSPYSPHFPSPPHYPSPHPY